MGKRRQQTRQLAAAILEMVASQPEKGVRRADILRYVGQVDKRYFRETLDALVAAGRLVSRPGGRFVCAEDSQLRRGVVHANAKGFGFVHFEDGSPDAFIPADGMCGALSGDTVLVQLDATVDVRGPSGVIRRIVSRGHEEFVGCLDYGERGLVVRPLRRELPVSLPVQDERQALELAKVGDWVQARMVPGRHDRSPVLAEVVRRLAAAKGIVSDLNAIVKEYGLHAPYRKDDERRFEGFTPPAVPREDFTGLVSVTIDPIDAKDYDDALSCEEGPRPGTVGVGVRIADVACFVEPDGTPDKQARRRGFTSYLPGRTLPMLPEILANRLCSLRAGEEHPAHSVLLTVDLSTGEVVGSRRCHSMLRVTRRLNYEEAQRCLEGDASVELPENVEALLRRLHGAARALRRWREGVEQFLPLGLAEYQVLTGGRPLCVQGIVRREAKPSNELVEEFMLAANVEVAKELQSKGLPGLYRNHAEPEPKGLGEFVSLAGAVLGRRLPDLTERGSLVPFLRGLSGSTGGELLSMAFLRCLPRAQYGVDCEGHFGLGKPTYAHFTSPIRRYADLLVHQQLLAHDLGRPIMGRDVMRERCEQINEQEINTDQAAFAALDRLKLRYLEGISRQRPGECLEAYVLKASPETLTCYLPSVGLMGFLETDGVFGQERWHYDSRSSSLVHHNGQSYRCGSVIYVQIRSIDVVHGDLLLRPARTSLR